LGFAGTILFLDINPNTSPITKPEKANKHREANRSLANSSPDGSLRNREEGGEGGKEYGKTEVKRKTEN
jgi:hypothetical protein